MIIVEMRDGRTMTYKSGTHWTSNRNQIVILGTKLGPWEKRWQGHSKTGRSIYKRERKSQVFSIASFYSSAITHIEIGGHSVVKKAPKGFVPICSTK